MPAGQGRYSQSSIGCCGAGDFAVPGPAPLAEIAGHAREHGLLLVEDCAQAFIGDGHWRDGSAGPLLPAWRSMPARAPAPSPRHAGGEVAPADVELHAWDHRQAPFLLQVSRVSGWLCEDFYGFRHPRAAWAVRPHPAWHPPQRGR
jgi:hypothetical protein